MSGDFGLVTDAAGVKDYREVRELYRAGLLGNLAGGGAGGQRVNPVIVEIRETIAADDYGLHDAAVMQLNGSSWVDSGGTLPIRKITAIAIEGTTDSPVRMIAKPVSNLGFCVEPLNASDVVPYYERPQQFCCGRCLDNGVRVIGSGETAKEAPSGYGVHVPVMKCCPNCDTAVGGDTAAALSDTALDLRYESASGLYVSDEASCGDEETVRWEFEPLTGVLEYKEQTSGVVLGRWSTSVVDPNPLCPYRLNLETISGVCYYCGEAVCVKPYLEASASCTEGYCVGVELPASLEVVLDVDLTESGSGSLTWQYIEDGGLGPDITHDYEITWPHASTIGGRVVQRLVGGYNPDGSPIYAACEWWGGQAFASRIKGKNSSSWPPGWAGPCRYDSPSGCAYTIELEETVPHFPFADMQGTSLAHGGSGSPWSSCPVVNIACDNCSGVRWGWSWKVYLVSISSVLKLRVELIRKARTRYTRERPESAWPICHQKETYFVNVIPWPGKPTLDFINPADSNLGGAIVARWEVNYDCGEGPWTLTKTFDTYTAEPVTYAITNLPSTIVVKTVGDGESPSDPRHCTSGPGGGEEPPPP